MNVIVSVSGPVFNGQAQRAAADYAEALRSEVAWQAYAEARQVMDASFRNPTPYYEVQTTVQPRGEEMVVHDRRIVYGRWLETGQRRGRPTRFAGYHMFRRATQAVLPQVLALARHVLPPFLRRMG